MNNYKQTIIDYIEGRISPKDFESMLDSDEALITWIQTNIVIAGKQYSDLDMETRQVVYQPYHIRLRMKKLERLDMGGPKGSVGYHHYLHKEFIQLMNEAFPDLELYPDTKPAILNDMKYDVIPEYIDGQEVAASNILTEILESVPLDIAKSKRIKLAKERVRAAFHIEGRKYPHWIQPAEWPVSNGKPMRYIKTTKVNPEFVQHHFEDVDTGEARIVDDFF